MKKSKRYIQEYISILNMKIGKDFPYKKHFFINFGVAFSITITIFLGIGYIFNYLENFNYVAYSINAAVFGSFLFSLFERERDIQKQLEKSYDTFLGIVLDLMYIFMIQMSVTTILFFFVFSPIVNNANILFCVILSTILFILHFTLAIFSDNIITNIENITETVFYADKELQILKAILYIILIHQFYMISYYVHIFDSINIMTVFWTVILLMLLAVKYYLRNTYIYGLSHPGVRYTIYYLVLVMSSTNIPRLSYDLELRDIVYLDNKPDYEEIGVIVTPEVINYSYNNIIIYDGHIIIGRNTSDSGEREIIKNDYISSKTIIYNESSEYGFESITLMEDGYHHVMMVLENDNLVEIYHEISIVEPSFVNVNETLGGRTGPARIYQSIIIDDKIYCRTEIGLIVFNKEFEIQDLIHLYEDIPADIQTEIDKFDTSPYEAVYGDYKVRQDKETLEMVLWDNDIRIELESPFSYFIGDTSYDKVQGLLVTDDYYIVYTFENVVTFNKDGEYVDSIMNSNMEFSRNSYIDDNKLITIYTSFYDEKFYKNEDFKVYEIDPSHYGDYVLREEYRSWINCDISYGCTSYNPMSLSPYIYLQFLASIMIIAIPSSKSQNINIVD